MTQHNFYENAHTNVVLRFTRALVNQNTIRKILKNCIIFVTAGEHTHTHDHLVQSSE